ncbi:hypothetical protein GW756_05210 [bacterium]|nr:hypothetical protein [bacterium]NCQ55777.1 hypothetical protein [Candidatus Parcubacteria bacterium]NCS67726.1 hypothetical protein [Candidatus Peregrinibacteria bacterium]NCS96740.1 hypothetical protein [bacterium]
MTHIITFHSPKSAGSTVTALNTALILAYQEPFSKTALIQLAPFGDLPQYLGKDPSKHWGDLLPFVNTPEATLENLKKGSFNLGADVFCSPPLALWSEIDLTNFKSFWQWISQHYDKIVVDISRGINDEIHQFLMQAADRNILVTTVDPVSLNAVKVYWESNASTQNKTQFILNQCPTNGVNFVERALKKNAINRLCILPFDEKNMWYQLFEGLPVCFKKRSPFAKALALITPKL